MNIDNMDPRACLHLMVDVLKLALIDRDIEYLRSSRCKTLLSYIPDKTLENAFGLDPSYYLEDMQKTLVKNVMSGKYISMKYGE